VPGFDRFEQPVVAIDGELLLAETAQPVCIQDGQVTSTTNEDKSGRWGAYVHGAKSRFRR